MAAQLILASQSPRRAELLQQAGLTFTQSPAEIDETPNTNEPPLEYVLRMAESKASAVYQQLLRERNVNSENKMVVLGSDTIGEINGDILVKPTDFKDFRRMMTQMSNNVHCVHTAIAVCDRDHLWSEIVSAEVKFGKLSEFDIEWYWGTGEPQDKAGGYAIQGKAGQFVKQIKGSYSAIVGLPLFETVNMLKLAGISLHER